MAKLSSFPFVDAGATDHVGLGHAIGEALRDRIRGHIDAVVAQMLSQATRERLLETASALRSEAAPVFPDYLEEIDATAAAAGVDPDHMLLTACEESALMLLGERCTTVAFAAPGCLLLGHNEDWLVGYEDSFYVVRARLPDGAAFLSLAYLASPPGSSIALNSHGLAFSGNSLIGQRRRGLAKNLILRSLIEARSLDDFERRATRQPRALSTNAMALDRTGRALDIELSLDGHAVIGAENGVLAHTNHVLSPALEALDPVERPSSRRRLRTANDMARAGPLGRDLMERLLRSHDHWPTSVCQHAENPADDTAHTVASAIADLGDLSLSVANGPPCGHDYVTFRLEQPA